MQNNSSEQSFEYVGKVARILIPPLGLNSKRILIQLHGWKGNENVMDLFSKSIRKYSWIISPRGFIKSIDGGFGWANGDLSIQMQSIEFVNNSCHLMDFLNKIVNHFQIEPTSTTLIGFSQGAGMAFSLAMQYPTYFQKLAVLSGFIPVIKTIDIKDLQKMHNISVFISHGRNDKIVSIDSILEYIPILQKAGFLVKFCESDSGHKVDVSCFHELDAFINS